MHAADDGPSKTEPFRRKRPRSPLCVTRTSPSKDGLNSKSKARFEVMAAPGLVNSMQQGQRVASDPSVLKLMLALGTTKGPHGVGLFMATPSSIISRTPIRHLADFKGKKIRIFASPFQSVAFERLGVTPVAMTLADVLRAIQQGAINGADSALNVYVPFHYVDAAKYVTETDQPAIFIIMDVSQTSRWRVGATKSEGGRCGLQFPSLAMSGSRLSERRTRIDSATAIISAPP